MYEYTFLLRLYHGTIAWYWVAAFTHRPPAFTVGQVGARLTWRTLAFRVVEATERLASG